jgi:transcriptional regulator with XRE-family HTH domain
MRHARAALNWSLERLAEVSGVHRNTLSNFENRKCDCEPETLSAVRRALEGAGMVFTKDDREGVELRRFQVGDRVRFRARSRIPADYGITAGEIGKVVDVEPHPPLTGPTYKIQVRFRRIIVPFVFRFEYELVQAVSDAEEPASPKSSDPIAIVDEFCIRCEFLWMDRELFLSLFDADRRLLNLYNMMAPKFFSDLFRIMVEHLFLQFSKITDPAHTGKHSNLTTNYILVELDWPIDVRRKLREVNERLKRFRQYIEPARSKRVAHIDVSAQFARLDNLGEFPKGADKQFLHDLQIFVDIAYGHLHGGVSRPINVAMSTDTHRLLRALEKAVLFDGCCRCTEDERIAAILDYEDDPGSSQSGRTNTQVTGSRRGDFKTAS